MLIWTNFDSFAIIYLGKLLQKFHFPMKVVLNCLQTKKSLELVLRLQFLLNVLIKLFPVEYNMNWPNFITRMTLPFKLFSKMYFLFLLRHLMTSWNLKIESSKV